MSHQPTLSQRLLIHADNMQGEGWYTTANVLAEAAERLTALPPNIDAAVASIRTRVGQIRAAKSPSAIELACDKLLEAASDLERATSSLSSPLGAPAND